MNTSIPLRMQSLIEELRPQLNTSYARASENGKKIDPEVWLDHVAHRVLPIVERIDHDDSQRARAAMVQLYEVSLILFAKGAFRGPAQQSLERLWEQVLPALSSSIAKEPKRLSGSLSNAVVAMVTLQPSIVASWLDMMSRLASHVVSGDDLLRFGKVAAWISGMAEYRKTAIEEAKGLPKDLLRLLWEGFHGLEDSDLDSILDRWGSEPWAFSDNVERNVEPIRYVGSCGDFRGFGGVWLKPPKVGTFNGSLLLTDGELTLELFADRFGASLRRYEGPTDEIDYAGRTSEATVDSEGTIYWKKKRLAREELTHPTSFVSVGSTLAVTIGTSFRVYLFALRDGT
ncbi:MAG: hypothetical protein U0905_07045 [Pirellulales bacterium]